MPQNITHYTSDLSSAFASFTSAFHPSRKGNLWRKYLDPHLRLDLTLTIFQRNNLFSWSVAGPDGVAYSLCRFDTQSEALLNLFETLEDS